MVAITRDALIVLKKSRDEIIGRTVVEVLPADPDDPRGSEGQEALMASLRKVVETGERDVLPVQRYAMPSTVAGNNRFVEHYWSAVNAPVFDAQGRLKYVLHVTQDVTGIIDAGTGKVDADTGVERLKADVLERTKELKRVNEHLQLAQRVANLGSWELRLPEFRRHWSSEIYRILGITPESLDENSSMRAFIHPDDRERVLKAREEALRGRDVAEVEHRIVRPDGETRIVVQRGRLITDSEGRPQLLYGTMQDVTEARKAEAEIKELETRLASTLENITDAFITLDREWRFTYVNRRAEQILHRSREELLGRIAWDEFEPAVNSSFYTEYHRAADEGKTVKFEEHYAPIDAWLGVTAYPSGDGLAVYFRDITEQKRNEAALRESEERFRVVAKATADTIWDWNLQTDAVWWNEGLCNVFGFRPEQIEPDSRSFLLRIHPDDKQRVVDIVQCVLENGADEWKADYRFRRANGAYADVIVRGYVVRDVHGKPVRMVGGMNDISEAKDKENRLARQAALLDKAHDAIIVHDMQHRIQYWNRSAERIYGWSSEEAVGQPIYRLLYEDEKVFDEAFESLIKAGEWSGEIRQHRKNGSTVVAEVSWSLVTDDAGKPEAIMSVNSD
ncbi:MAG: PAS domain S-box protein, partial [Proteobacteria bacterium]|nr:PAS domain S-box protein [Pseudomonadota bacterium]